jgi:hypothetical protein
MDDEDDDDDEEEDDNVVEVVVDGVGSAPIWLQVWASRANGLLFESSCLIFKNNFPFRNEFLKLILKESRNVYRSGEIIRLDVLVRSVGQHVVVVVVVVVVSMRYRIRFQHLEHIRPSSI